MRTCGDSKPIICTACNSYVKLDGLIEQCEPSMKIHRLILPTPQKGGPVNVYLVEDGDLTLIDTGPKIHDAWNKLNEELLRLDLRLQDVDKIVITHAHTDHCGMAGSVKQASGAKIYAHPLTAAWLRDPDRALHDYYYDRAVRFLRRIGMPQEVIATSYPEADMLRKMSEPASVDEVLQEGDLMRMGGSDWKVIYSPGHAESAICLFNSESRLMFCGDQLLLDVPSNPLVEPPRSSDEERPHTLSIYLRSLQRLATMEISTCFPGHGDVILDHRAVIQERHKRHERRKQLILNVLQGGQKTPYEIACAVISANNGFDVFLGVSDIVGHLDLLEEEGKVRQLDAGNVVYYAMC